MGRVYRYGAWVVAVAAATLATVVGDRFASGPWTGALRYVFAPGVIGYAFVGGVHGGASVRTQYAAWAVANGLFWGSVIWRGMRIVRRRFRSDSVRGAGA